MDSTNDRDSAAPDPQARSPSDEPGRELPPSHDQLVGALSALKQDVREVVANGWIVVRTHLDRLGIELRSLVVRAVGAVIALIVLTVFLCACALQLAAGIRGLAHHLSESSWIADLMGALLGFGLVALGVWWLLRSADRSTLASLAAKYGDPTSGPPTAPNPSVPVPTSPLPAGELP